MREEYYKTEAEAQKRLEELEAQGFPALKTFLLLPLEGEVVWLVRWVEVRK